MIKVYISTFGNITKQGIGNSKNPIGMPSQFNSNVSDWYELRIWTMSFENVPKVIDRYRADK